MSDQETTHPATGDSAVGLHDGSGCHGGRETLRAAAERAGNSEVLARYAADYPMGPHDQPQRDRKSVV